MLERTESTPSLSLPPPFCHCSLNCESGREHLPQFSIQFNSFPQAMLYSGAFPSAHGTKGFQLKTEKSQVSSQSSELIFHTGEYTGESNPPQSLQDSLIRGCTLCISSPPGLWEQSPQETGVGPEGCGSTVSSELKLSEVRQPPSPVRILCTSARSLVLRKQRFIRLMECGPRNQ